MLELSADDAQNRDFDDDFGDPPLPTSQPSGDAVDELPIIIPFPFNDSLRSAYRAALKHEGEIQSWDCPQGGRAYVLVIPRRNFVNSLSKKSA